MDEELEPLPGRVLVAGTVCTLLAVAALFATFVWLNAEPASRPTAVYKIF